MKAAMPVVLVIFFALFLNHAAAQITGFNYQAVLRNSSHAPIGNESGTATVSILNAVGTVLYSETHSISTDPLGLFNLVIGKGTNPSASFATVDWSSGGRFVKITVAVNGDTYDFFPTELQSVPYAKVAEKALQGDADANPMNEIQALSLNGKILNLSNGGGAVDLSHEFEKWQFSGSQTTGLNDIYRFGRASIGVSNTAAKFHVSNVEGTLGATNNTLANFYNSIGNGYSDVIKTQIGPDANPNLISYALLANAALPHYSGYFDGRVYIAGDFYVAGTKNFRIDHPADPQNKYLQHFCSESNVPLNMYTGNATTGSDGVADIELPEYFTLINKDFRYQLTPVGQFAQVIVLREIEGNHFKIKSDVPGVKVSWMVIAERNDPYMQQHPPQDVLDKPSGEKGKYTLPELYNQPKEMGVNWEREKRGAAEKE
ncbi:MAG: hypothetical protein IPN76_34080 [Saprospiraceae bacterium]|nr:hypothetical protein [Saprospiraceae bacterium]